MSYREEDGRIVISMSRLDYERLLVVFAIAMSSILSARGMLTFK